jgi:hypothetical protein
MTTILVAIHCGAVVLALGLVARAAFRAGWDACAREALDDRAKAVRDAFEAGHAAGGDDLSRELVEASLNAPDVIELAWPAAARAERRPQ